MIDFTGAPPKRFHEASYKDWEEGSVIRTLIDRYLQGFAGYFAEGRAPLLLGNSGLGKSRAAAAILNAVRIGSKGRYSTSWAPASEAMNLLLDAKDMRNTSMYALTYRTLMESDLLVLDDFTTLRDAPRLKEYFWIVTEARYNNNKPTIFTANFTIKMDDDIEDFWHNVGTHFNTPFVRRLKEVGKELTLII